MVGREKDPTRKIKKTRPHPPHRRHPRRTESTTMDEFRPQNCPNCTHLISRHGDKGCDACDCQQDFQLLTSQIWDRVTEKGANGHGPSHYTGGTMQPWDVIEAFELDYFLGNVIKYVLRAGRKDIAPKVEDLKKARHCLDKAIEREEKRQ